MAVSGKCDQKFAKVKEEFERSFAERGEVGASVCLSVNGETAVDLWGGLANPETGIRGRKIPFPSCFRAPRRPSRCARTS